MAKFKTYGCLLEDDDAFCDLWAKRQARSIWGDQQPSIRHDWQNKTVLLGSKPNIGHSTRPINFNAVPKDEPSRMLKFPRHRDRNKNST